ncbi:MAG TPA: protein kinase, partial [Byssovorax sp.]
QLYDVGEHAGSTYLALEYLDGESLRERARREQLSLDEILRIVRAIADALVHAHAASVRHCDLKPSNVMLPRDGRVRVVDFGLSSIAGVGGTAGGTPEWMAPEQWRAEPITERVDVWALAVMLHQLVCRGAHPFGHAEDSAARRVTVLDPTRAPASLEGKVPAPVADLVRRSLARDPAIRPPATEWALVLDRVLSGQPAVPTGGEAPYRGLTAFDSASAHLFHGRDADIDGLLERLRDATMLAIVGPSGAGKSSLMHAGVIPRLLARERWTVIAVRPATDPFHALASRIAEADGTPEAERAERVVVLAHELRATPTLLALRLTTIALATNTRVLLAIDQLEELFTQGISAGDAAAFVAMLAKTSDEPSDPVRVVITLRDDFSGRVHGLRDVFVLRPMTAVELRRAIAAPLAHTGFKFEDEAIADDMIAELGGDANLPLLQFACRALWDARDTERRVLSRAAYVDLGGVAGALARHADRFLAGLSVEQRAATRTLLLRLVTSNATRRIVERSAVLADLPDGDAVLAKLVAARLVVQRRGDGDGAVYVEVVHESLLVAWGQLREWIDRTADQRAFLDELAEAVTVWVRRGRADGATWPEAEV